MGLKARTIKAVIRKKIDAWLESIEDEDLRKLCAKEVIVTGGCIASMQLGEKINDFDVYLRTKETVERITDYYVEKFLAKRKPQEGIPVDIRRESLKDSNGRDRVRIVVKSAGVANVDQETDYAYFEGRPDHEAGEYLEEAFDPLSDVDIEPVPDTMPDFEPVFLSSNAISLKGKIQLVIRFFGDPDEIHENYDFAHCTSYWTPDGLVLRPEAMEALLTKELRYQGSRYPLCSIIRTRKFIQRGWRINAGQYLKMVMQLQEMDLKDPKVLEEQLTGVDVAYFSQMIHRLMEKDPTKVDTAYLTEIIDRMF